MLHKIIPKLILLAFLLFVLPTTVTYAQVGNSRLYLGIDDYGCRTEAFLKNVGNKSAKVILGDKIYPDIPKENEEASVNIDTLTKYVLKAFPDFDEKGVGVLDWEGRSFDILILFPTDSPGFKFVINQFIKTLKIAKQLRPNVSWGFFGLPFKQGNFKTKQDWTAGNKRIEKLLLECDIFCPNLYGYTPNDLGNLDDVKESLKLGINYNKKVYPFIWHRFNGLPNGDFQVKLINKNQFISYADSILNTTHNFKKVDGVIWWGFDTYFYKHKYNDVDKEAPTLKAFIRKYDRLIIDYSKDLIRIK